MADRNEGRSQQQQTNQPPPSKPAQQAQQSQPGQSQQGMQKKDSDSEKTARNTRSPEPNLALAFNLPDLLDPFAMFRRLNDDMGRMLAPTGRASADPTSGLATWLPPIEIEHYDGKYVVTTELPGLRPEDVRVEVADDSLIIQGERKFEREEGNGGIRRTERRYGRFYRVVPLPDGASADQAFAEFKDGVLEVSIPVAESKTHRKQVPIQGAGETGQRAQSSGQPGSSQAGSDKAA